MAMIVYEETIRSFGNLASDVAHVWVMRIGQSTGPSSLDALSEEERKRAESFRFSDDRLRYVAAHTMLRTLLGTYLQTTDRVSIEPDPAGKPHVPDGALEFNLSYSADLAAAVFALQGPVGIDVEAISDRVDPNWARKESLAKAIGSGLDGIDRHRVAGPSPVRVETDHPGMPSFMIHDLAIDDGYFAAVTCPDRTSRIDVRWFGPGGIGAGRER